MRFKSVAITNHPSIGSLALDFRDASGEPSPVVILAGGNGTGKSAILEAMFSLAGQTQSSCSVQCRLMLSAAAQTAVSPYFGVTTPGGDLQYTYDQQAGYSLSYQNRTQSLILHQLPNQLVRMVMLDAVTQFAMSHHQTISSGSLDNPAVQSMRSGDQLGSGITQLMIDINAADAEDVQNWLRDNPGSIVPPELLSVRLSRFRSAFEIMFPTKKLVGVERSAGQLRVVFEEYGVRSAINQLSTGEKQIVFKAGFLLSNRSLLRDAVVLIDEPELGLHPDWQARIIGFFRHILSDDAGHHPQIVCATHSPFVVHGIGSGKVIILERDAAGAVREMPEPAYPGVHGLEAVRAFNLDRFLDDAQKPLLVLTEGESDASIIATAWIKLFPTEARPFDLRAALGAKNINITLNDQDIVAKIGGRKLLGLFDYDVAYGQWKGAWRGKWRGATALAATTGTDAEGRIKRHASGQAWCMLLPVPAFRSDYANDTLEGASILSIEFLFQDSDIPPPMRAERPIAGGHTLPYIPDGQKTAFATHVSTLPSTSFEAFRPLFDRIRAILVGTV